MPIVCSFMDAPPYASYTSAAGWVKAADHPIKLVSLTKRTAAPKSHSSGSKQVSGVEMGEVLWANRAKRTGPPPCFTRCYSTMLKGLPISGARFIIGRDGKDSSGRGVH